METPWVNLGKMMHWEFVRYKDEVKKVSMDSKADDQKLYLALQKLGIQLVTFPAKAPTSRPEEEMLTPQNHHDYKKRSTTVEPWNFKHEVLGL